MMKLTKPALRTAIAIPLVVVVLLRLISCAKLAPPEPPSGLSDTTSHSLEWHFDCVGEGLGGQFLDVAVLNDSLAYAVGNFYENNSAGNLDPILYNVANGMGAFGHRNAYTTMSEPTRLRAKFPLSLRSTKTIFGLASATLYTGMESHTNL